MPYTVFYASLKKVSNRKCPNHHFVLSAHLYTYCFKIELTFYCYITKPAIINIGHKDVKVRILEFHFFQIAGKPHYIHNQKVWCI